MFRKPAAVLASVLVALTLLSAWRPGGLMAYVLPSACWAFIALITLRVCGFERVRLWLNKQVLMLATLIAGTQALVLVSAGLLAGFGRSPLSFTPLGLAINLVLVSSTLLGTELSRGYIVKSYGRRAPFLAVALAALLYSLAPMVRLSALIFGDPLALVRFLGATVLPTIAENFLASYLALLGGPVASLAYRAPLEAFWWFSPILPNLPWGVKTLVGVMVPALGFVAVDCITTPALLRRAGLFREAASLSKERARRGPPLGWVATLALCVVAVWTASGLLGLYPRVVASGSMRPAMDVGDVAIIAQTPIDRLKLGDIIAYWRGRNLVIHRISDIRQSAGRVILVTKGDANADPDHDPVFPLQVVGKVILIVPKVGWLSIYAKGVVTKIVSYVANNAALACIALTSVLTILATVTLMRKKRAFKRRVGW